MMKKEFEIHTGGVKIAGEIHSPDITLVLPTIILSHEFGLSMLSTRRYAKRLYRYGYHVFIYDFPGSGAGKSKGRKSTQMSVQTEKDDLEAVYQYVKMQVFVDRENIFLGGASQGGMVTALFAAQHTEIKKIFLYYPAFCIPYDARSGNILGTKVDVNNIPDEFVAMGYVKLGRKYVEDAQILDPWREIKAYQNPVLICHGTKDSIVDISYARKAKEEYAHAELVEFNGANHCFFLPSTVKGTVKLTVDFLQR